MSGPLDALMARLEQLIEKRVAKVEPFRATVKAVGTGLVTIRRVESVADDDEEYARVAGFTLQVGDEVVCVPIAGKPVVVGRLQRSAITDLDLTVQDLTITGSLTGGGAGATGPTGPTGPTGAFSALASNGIVAQTATTPTYAARTITGTTNQIAVTNGDGVSGNPTVAIARDPSVTGNVVATYDATTPRPVIRVNGDNSLASGSLGGFQLYRGANLAAEFKVDASGTVDFWSYAAAGSNPDFRIFSNKVVKLIPQQEAAGEAFRFDVDTSSTGTYGYSVFTEAKSGNTAGATWKHFNGSGLAIEASAGFLKLGAASAVPVTISQSGQTTTIGGALAVSGDTTLDGDVTLGNAYADQIYIAGRLRTASGLTAPTLTNGGATVIGTSPTVSITGTDTTGQIAITTGTSVSATGTLVTFNFNTARPNATYTVMLTPQSQAAGQQFTRFNVGTRTSSSWILTANTTLSSSTTYQFFYWIVNYA